MFLPRHRPGVVLVAMKVEMFSPSWRNSRAWSFARRCSTWLRRQVFRLMTLVVRTRSKHAKQMLSKSVCATSTRTRCYGSIKCCCAQKRRLRLAHTSRAAASRRIQWLPLALVTRLNSGTAYRDSCWDEDIPSENWLTADLREILTEGWAAVVAGSMITSGIA